jgi:hypothetical protein
MKASRLRELLNQLADSLDEAVAADLRTFASQLAAHDERDLQSLKVVAKPKDKKASVNQSGTTLKKKRGASDAMIRNYLERLRSAYQMDASFEEVIQDIEADKTVTKGDVERIYNDVFETQKAFPEKRTKVQRIEDLRRERLKRIRFDAA